MNNQKFFLSVMVAIGAMISAFYLLTYNHHQIKMNSFEEEELRPRLVYSGFAYGTTIPIVVDYFPQKTMGELGKALDQFLLKNRNLRYFSQAQDSSSQYDSSGPKVKVFGYFITFRIIIK